jgi:hypothetical protein
VQRHYRGKVPFFEKEKSYRDVGKSVFVLIQREDRRMDIPNRKSFIRMVLGNVVTYGCSMNFYFFCIIVAIFSF